ncbi:MAG: aldolase/citrate lyase family protein [Pseudonocardia sp.]|nr:aldolase/citrate lyase family protein [Pseudonocardia sp.]
MDQVRLAGDAVGGWLQLPGPATAELMGSVGYDFVCVDTQHGLIGDDALLPMLQALAATGTPSLVRVSHNGLDVIGRALDRGASGVIVPLVESVEQAAAAVSACRYPPHGTRSFGPTRVSWSGRDVLAPGLCAVMIETAAGLDALPGILQVDGLDAIFVGPSDLALGTGRTLAEQDTDPAYDELLGSIAARCGAAGLPVGIYCASAAHVRRFRDLGFTWFAGPAEGVLLRSAAATSLRESR